MKVKRVRQKECQQCRHTKDTLYRVRERSNAPWQFVCKECLLPLRNGNFNYQYGGTWKSKKRT